MNRHTIVAALAAATLILVIPLAAQESRKQDEPKKQAPDPRVEIKERMKLRFAELDKLRDAEKIGETHGGLVEAVKPAYAQEKVDPANKKSATISELIEAENKDRKALFDLLAKDLKLTPDAVARQNGVRTLEKSADKHWVKLEDGRWVQKKSIRAEKK